MFRTRNISGRPELLQTKASGVIPELARPDAARMTAHGGLLPDVAAAGWGKPRCRQKPTRAGGDVLMSCRPASWPASRACPAWSAPHGLPAMGSPTKS